MMKALTKKLPVTSVIFVEPRYWPDPDELSSMVAAAHTAILGAMVPSDSSNRTLTITCEEELSLLQKDTDGGLGVFTALSGGVQPWMIKAASRFSSIVIAGCFIKGFLEGKTSDLLLKRNAAPASMDVFSVLRYQQRGVILARTPEELDTVRRATQAVMRLRSSSMLLIGGTEPWVISSCNNTATFASRLGITIKQIPLGELYDLVRTAASDETAPIAADWMSHAQALHEPVPADILDASRVTIAFRRLLDMYEADGIAIACFAMLKELGTTSCLAISALNDMPHAIGGCEGDLDAAVTMMMMKALTEDAVWMGNPVPGRDNHLMLVHCTAPRGFQGKRQEYILRNHHESGIGVSPAVHLPVDEPVTLCRIGRNASAMSVHVGRAVSRGDGPTCRTQLRIELSSMDRYLATSLGNHQVLAYGDHAEALRLVAGTLSITFLN